MNGLDALLRTELVAFGLEVARVTGVIIVTPFLWQQAPKTIRAAMILALAVLVHGHGRLTPDLVAHWEWVVPCAMLEFAVGAAVGFVVRLTIAIAEIAANAIAPLIGFGAAQVFDPTTGGQDTVLTTLIRTMAVWIAVIVGLHRVVVGGLLASFRAFPVGSVMSPGLAAPLLVEMSARALSSGVRLALPIIAVLFMLQISLGFIARAAPSMQIFSIGFATLLIAGGVVLWMSVPDMARELIVEFSNVGASIESVFAAVVVR